MTDNLYVREEYVNATKGYFFGDSGDDPYESYTDDKGDLFRSLQGEYGRCISKVYVGYGKPVGWVFVKRAEYTDTGETYLQETWITLHEKPPTRTVEYHYAD